jgi:hypothetical protein
VLEVLRGLPRVGARRAIRVTLAGSGTFSFLFEVMHNPTAAFFAAFGCVVLLVYVEFGGPKRQRFEQHIGLIVLTSIFVVLGTLCSQVLWLAVTSAVIVCFCVLMSGVVSSSLASATSGMLISFLLPVAFQGPLSTIPDRLLGWAIAGVVSLLAVVFILPTPSSDPLVDVTADTLATLSLYVRTVAVATGPEPPGGSTPSAYSDVVRASDQLRTAFFTAPFRPAGLSASARLLVKVIEWTLELDLLLTGEHLDSRVTGDEEVRALISLCSDVLEESAVALTSATSDTVTLTQALLDVQVARRQLEGSSLRSLHRHETSEDASTPDSHDVVLLRVLDQSFRVDNVANTIEKLGTEVLELVASQQRTWWQQSLGLEAKGADSRAGAARRRLASHLFQRAQYRSNRRASAHGDDRRHHHRLPDNWTARDAPGRVLDTSPLRHLLHRLCAIGDILRGRAGRFHDDHLDLVQHCRAHWLDHRRDSNRGCRSWLRREPRGRTFAVAPGRQRGTSVFAR